MKLVVKESLVHRATQLSSLTVASVAGAGVGSAGAPGTLRAVAGALRSLDLGACLIGDWAAVGALGPELPALDALDLSNCRLAWPATWPSPPAPPPAGALLLAALRVLVLNGTRTPWAHVQAAQGGMPCLEALHMCRCGLRGLSASTGGDPDPTPLPPVTGFPRLLELTLDGNDLSDWAEAERLSGLPSLTRLHWGGNRLTDVRYPPGAPGAPPPFGSLTALLVGGNAITDWQSVGALDAFPALTEARLSGNPLVAAGASLGRAEIVARCGKLRALNGAAIGTSERRDAEIRYLRRLITAQEDPREALSPQDLATQHPRYAALLDKLGYLVASGPAGGPGGGPRSLADDLLAVTLSCVAAAGAGKPPVSRKLPDGLTLSKLKQLAESLFKVRSGKMAVFLRRPGEPIPERLDGEDLTLAHFGVPPAGAELLIDEPGE